MNNLLAEKKHFPALEEIPIEFRIEKCEQGLNYLINGEILNHYGKGVEVRSPVYVKKEAEVAALELGEYPALGKKEALRALDAAERAYGCGLGKWPRMSVDERIEHVEEFMWRIRPMEKIFSLMEMWEIGKGYKSCLDEFQRTMQYMEDTISSLKSMENESDSIIRADNFIAQIRRCPIGTSLCMGPFNYPLNETFAMLIPALIMGNTIVMKPPKYGALCTVPFMDAFVDSFPPGVVNIINGDGAEIIGPIMETGKISILGFIGSTRVANLLAQQHPCNNRMRTILGLEAKNPAFVFADADIELATSECINGALEFNGQRCTSIKHIWVHRSIADEFLAVLSRKIEQARCGMPWEDDVMITPLPEEGKTRLLGELVEEALNKGASIVNAGGGRTYGNLFYPAVLYPVNRDMKIYQVEQFGPLIPVSSFSRLDELFDYLIETDYGQQASIFSSSPENAAPLIDVLINQVSRINLNAQCRRGPDELPFTGRKDSAEGTLSVYDALRSFSIRSLVVANEQGRELFFRTIESGKSKFLKI